MSERLSIKLSIEWVKRPADTENCETCEEATYTDVNVMKLRVDGKLNDDEILKVCNSCKDQL